MNYYDKMICGYCGSEYSIAIHECCPYCGFAREEQEEVLV